MLGGWETGETAEARETVRSAPTAVAQKSAVAARIYSAAVQRMNAVAAMGLSKEPCMLVFGGYRQRRS